MKIFMSWSGDRSKKVAELLDDWLQCVIQAVDPWLSSKDIDRGSIWFSEITNQLKDTGIGIICLTKENLNKPWILFEAGALTKGITSNRVCTFLIDLKVTQVGNPLAQFNHTLPKKDDLWQLMTTINNALEENALKEKILEQVFETYWPTFNTEFKKIIKETPESDAIVEKTEHELLSEVLFSTRSMERRIRKIENSKRLPYIHSLNKKTRFKMKDIDIILQNCISSGLTESEAIEEVIRQTGMRSVDAMKIINDFEDSR